MSNNNQNNQHQNGNGLHGIHHNTAASAYQGESGVQYSCDNIDPNNYVNVPPPFSSANPPPIQATNIGAQTAVGAYQQLYPQGIGQQQPYPQQIQELRNQQQHPQQHPGTSQKQPYPQPTRKMQNKQQPRRQRGYTHVPPVIFAHPHAPPALMPPNQFQAYLNFQHYMYREDLMKQEYRHEEDMRDKDRKIWEQEEELRKAQDHLKHAEQELEWLRNEQLEKYASAPTEESVSIQMDGTSTRVSSPIPESIDLNFVQESQEMSPIETDSTHDIVLKVATEMVEAKAANETEVEDLEVQGILEGEHVMSYANPIELTERLCKLEAEFEKLRSLHDSKKNTESLIQQDSQEKISETCEPEVLVLLKSLELPQNPLEDFLEKKKEYTVYDDEFPPLQSTAMLSNKKKDHHIVSVQNTNIQKLSSTVNSISISQTRYQCGFVLPSHKTTTRNEHKRKSGNYSQLLGDFKQSGVSPKSPVPNVDSEGFQKPKKTVKPIKTDEVMRSYSQASSLLDRTSKTQNLPKSSLLPTDQKLQSQNLHVPKVEEKKKTEAIQNVCKLEKKKKNEEKKIMSMKTEEQKEDCSGSSKKSSHSLKTDSSNKTTNAKKRASKKEEPSKIPSMAKSEKENDENTEKDLIVLTENSVNNRQQNSTNDICDNQETQKKQVESFEDFLGPNTDPTEPLVPEVVAQSSPETKRNNKNKKNKKKEKKKNTTSSDTGPLSIVNQNFEPIEPESLDLPNHQSSASKESIPKTNNVLESELLAAVMAYVDKMHAVRHSCLALRRVHKSVNHLQDIIFEYWRENFAYGLTMKWKSAQITLHISKCIAKYRRMNTEHGRLMSTFFGVLLLRKEEVIMEDMICLFGQKSLWAIKCQDTMEQWYYNMIKESPGYNFDDFETVPVHLENLWMDSKAIQEPYRTSFSQHVNSQFFLRHDVKRENEGDINERDIERAVREAYITYESYPQTWSREETRKFLRSQKDKLESAEEKTKETEIYINFYEFLLCYESSIIDFDAYWFHHCQEYPCPDVLLNNEKDFFNLIFNF